MSLNLFCLSPLSSAGCSGFADCLLTLPQLLTFPVDHERDGVELALLSEAVSLDLDDFIPTVLGIHDKFAKDYILCAAF